MTTVINSKSRKEVIYEAYQKAQQELAALRGNVYDPIAEQEGIRMDGVMSTATALSSDFNLEENLRLVERSIASQVSSVFQEIQKRAVEFKELDEAINAKQTQLTALTGIESAVMDLVAFTNTQEDLKLQYDKDLKDVRNEIQIARDEWNAELSELQAKANARRDAEEQEWQEEFNRTKRRAQIDLDDELEAKRKEHAASVASKEAELGARDKAIKAKEDEFNRMQVDIANFPTEIESIVQTEVEKVQSELTKAHADEKKILEIQHKAELSSRDDKIKLLESEQSRHDAKVSELQKKLDEAYGRIQDMAVQQSNAFGMANTRQIDASNKPIRG